MVLESALGTHCLRISVLYRLNPLTPCFQSVGNGKYRKISPLWFFLYCLYGQNKLGDIPPPIQSKIFDNIKEWKNSTCWLVLVVILKLWFSVLLKLRSHIITHYINGGATPSMFWDYQPHIMGIRPQNMTQTSNSLLSQTKSMVAMGNQW